MNQTLIIFAREPIAGRTKTRLCPAFSSKAAAELYKCFLADVLALITQLPEVRPIIAYTPDSNGEFFAQFAPEIDAMPQCGAGLGERMDYALRHGLETSTSVVLIGSDSPDLPVGFVCEAFSALADGADVVFGPASDGGYYLIGVRAPQPHLLCGVTMSTPTVLADTLAIARELNLRVHLLPQWHDVDTIDDIWALKGRLQHTPFKAAPATRAFLAELEDEIGNSHKPRTKS